MTRESEQCATGDATAVLASCVLPRHLRVVRVGHGGNCSSVGSVVDTLFLSAVAGGAILAAICAAMQEEKITVVAEPREARGVALPEDEERDDG